MHHVIAWVIGLIIFAIPFGLIFAPGQTIWLILAGTS